MLGYGQRPTRLSMARLLFRLAQTWVLIVILTASTFLAAAQNPAASSFPLVKLAIVTEEEQARTYADLLTVEFSRHERLQLLERNEIDRVYREQLLSAANKDYLKLDEKYFKSILANNGILVDVKGLYRNKIKELTYWSL
mgnify:CR=1 FL=1